MHQGERRLTPNPRSTHQHWMSLSPGLGCAAILLFLDWQRLQQQNSPLPERGDKEDDADEDEDDHGGSDNDKEDFPDDDTNAGSTCSLC